MIDILNIKKLAEAKQKENKKFFEKVKKSPPKKLDEVTNAFHDKAFELIDCIACANCCKTTGPLFKQKDIERLASHFKIRPAQFIEKYLHIDEDNDYVLNVLPCPFLGSDNYCSVYESRPNACREYPHTNQRKIHTILKETYNNVAICPAVFEVVEELKKVF